ncbi:kinase-like protein [Thelephora ganbajun]|uniref:Kinase-like protein n=1 Tax=Thelephora ganbajun TaxID=370292 RepID=A0ACB6ZTK5_THEGA|nr:kinase-like protein [Thelephora ganbajun]
MSHALLLRLFLAPSFFTVHVALQYLALYSDNIGITYYLTRRLSEIDPRELRDVWGFICHLLVTRPSKSRALECFVVDVAQRSTHIAMLTLWFMQASLKDLSTNPTSQSFQVCQRVLTQCHEIIFGDLPTPTSSPYVTLQIPFQSRFARKKVRPLVQPALVGLGMVLAGAPGLPQLTPIMGQVAIEQGRVVEEGPEVSGLERELGQESTVVSNITNDDDDDDDDVQPPSDSPQEDEPVLNAGVAKLSRRTTIGPSQTTPTLPVHLVVKPRLSYDPFGQEDPQSISSPSHSSPSLLPIRKRRSNAPSQAETFLQRYDQQSLMYLLRSHFCRSEVQFLLTLENISNRLLIIPKPARVSALRAELTALNHMLPAEVCVPLWCASSDVPQDPDGIPQPHHRIVRIPPGESVVLNSAERAPYLLILEILHSDLDFNTNKRSNKEILRKIAIKESERKGASKDIVAFNATSNTTPTVSAEKAKSRDPKDAGLSRSEAILDTSDEQPPPPVLGIVDDEEMDLVEQLYGPNESIRSRPMDLSESVVRPPAPKNRDLDLVAWSRSSSIPTTPFPADLASHNIDVMPTSLQSSFPPSTDLPRSSIANGGDDLTLDDYSERMRTAAVMLAQLNANLARETAHAGDSSSQPTRRWFPGPPAEGAESSGPNFALAPEHQPSKRLRLQYAEATAIRERIMKEMMLLEEQRMQRMKEGGSSGGMVKFGMSSSNSAEDESIIRQELNKVDPSAVVFSESWANKKSRIRHDSPYGHLANWDCVSVIVKTGGDLRQEQLAVQLIQEFERIWREENVQCWVRYFRILITGGSSGLVETITDAVSIHSIKKAEYAKRLAQGQLGHVTLLDHFISSYGDPSSAKFARAQRNFAKSLAGCSLITYLLQIKDRHNGNILLDREGHLVHIDFGFMLSNSPGNLGFEAAPFKLPLEYVEVLGGVDSEHYREFKRLFKDGFEAARKHCDRIVTMVELMQKDSSMPCFTALGEQTAVQLRERFQQGLTHSLVAEHVDRLIETSLGSSWTRLYDSYQYYSQSIL